MKLCEYCKKRPATCETKKMIASGDIVPHKKCCDHCWLVFFPKKAKQETPVQLELHCVVVGEKEIRICGFDFMDTWLMFGYRLYGVSDTKEGIDTLYQQAKAVIR